MDHFPKPCAMAPKVSPKLKLRKNTPTIKPYKPSYNRDKTMKVFDHVFKLQSEVNEDYKNKQLK